ncbi:FHA domain-containing protein [Nocardia thailandica]|uniref:FHA domain-containing protein n=1 Tax=Nocardia thailandica TaxID=257275 RepID=A0ABW6PLZ5_9NOCA
MRTQTSTVAIVPGTGLVARFGEVVLYLAGETASTERMLGAVDTVANSTDASAPGAALAQRLAAVVFGGSSAPPPFGVLAPTGDGTLILLRGAVIAEISGAEGNRRLAGDRAFTWVDEIIREPVRRIAVAAETADPISAHPRTDLRSGVVTGDGFVFTLGKRRTPTPRRVTAPGEPPATAASGFRAVPEPTGATPVVPRAEATRSAGARASSDTAAAPAAPESGERATVRANGPESGPRAVTARTGHLPRTGATSGEHAVPEGPTVSAGPRHTPANHAPLAWSQALDAAARSVGLTKTPAPSGEDSLGSLITDDGVTYPLDRPYVLGRNPAGDESIRSASAAPILIERDRMVSRVHAYVAPDRGKVYVREAPSTSGTYLAAPGTDQWSRVGTTPVELPPGWRLRISERVLTYRA